MTGAPYFTVIVPTFNRPALLQEALYSLELQSFPDFEVLVIDDGGTTSVQLPDDARFRLLRQERNAGIAAARNRGIREAQGRFLAFLDDDDAFTVNRLEAAHAAHETGADLVFCGGADYRGVQDISMPRAKTYVHPAENSLGKTTVSRELCPEFDTQFPAAEDHDWSIRLRQRHPVTALVPTAHWLWRSHSSVRASHGMQARIIGLEMLLSKHASFFQAHPQEHADRHLSLAHQYYRNRARSKALKNAYRSFMISPSVQAVELVVCRC